jgi:hypothetical protein
VSLPTPSPAADRIGRLGPAPVAPHTARPNFTVGPPQEEDVSIELIRTAGPVANSVHDLIQTLSVKIDSVARYALYQEDAREDGYHDCAELFGRLEEQDRAAAADLISCRRNHFPAAP